MSVVCQRCGARVENATMHDEHHRDVDRALALQPVVAQLLGIVGELNDRTHDMRRECTQPPVPPDPTRSWNQ